MSESPPRGWNTSPEAQEAERAAAAKARESADEWEQLHAAVFGSGAGKKLLAEWHKRIIDAVPAGMPEQRALDVRLGRQQFVRELERLTEAGLQSKPKST